MCKDDRDLPWLQAVYDTDDEDTGDDAEGGPRAVTAWSADSTAIVRRWPEITLTARTPDLRFYNK